jgi:hydrogenase expression/formation protein HypC
MCIGVPGQIVQIIGHDGVIDIQGVRHKVNLFLVPEATIGDFVMVHAGAAIQIIDAEEAEEVLELLKEMFGDEGE